MRNLKEAWEAAGQIQKLISHIPMPQPPREAQIARCKAAFKGLDFRAAAKTARRAMESKEP